jgi:hypothetical protein
LEGYPGKNMFTQTKKLFPFLLLLLLGSPVFAGSISSSDRDALFQNARTFIEGITSKDNAKVASVLNKSIEIKYISKVDLKKKIDAMIQSQITAIDYLQMVSGYNSYKFLNEFDGRKWDVSAGPDLPKEILEETMEGLSGAKSTYYFIKFQLTVSELNTTTQQVKTFNRLVELDFLPDQGEFRIFGFII